MTGSRLIRVVAISLSVVVVGCGAEVSATDSLGAATGAPRGSAPASTSAPVESAATRTATPSSKVSEAPSGAANDLVVVSLGDSWPAGGHCDGCRTYAGRYADDLAATSGRHVEFIDLARSVVPETKRGATADSLLVDLREREAIREAVATGDIILVSVGLNTLDEGALDAYLAGTCGGADGADCFRMLGPRWRTAFGGILDEIEILRGDRPTAIRLVTAQNVFLDPSFAADFGPDFAMDQGALVVGLLADAMCESGAAHHVPCIDVRPILNGPTLDRAVDENSDASHQAVADALIESGLDELGIEP